LAWDCPPAGLRFFVDDPPLASGKLQFSEQPAEAPGRQFVFELRGLSAPKAVAVSWPNALLPSRPDQATPFLVLYHPSVNQATQAGFYNQPQSGSYSFGLDFCLFELWLPCSSWTEPLIDGPVGYGFPYQAATAGKNVVLVKVSNSLADEVGDFNKPGPLVRYLAEIRDYMCRSHSQYPPVAALIAGGVTSAPLGRLGVASFSNGARFIGELFQNSANTQFFLNELKEAYLFDPGALLNAQMPAAVALWANSGSTTDKMARLYHGSADALSTLIPGAPASGPFFLTNNKFTVAAVNPGIWTAAAADARSRRGLGAATTPPDAHHLFPAMFLTDALRRSAY
jgi:hypothetical protein